MNSSTQSLRRPVCRRHSSKLSVISLGSAWRKLPEAKLPPEGRERRSLCFRTERGREKIYILERARDVKEGRNAKAPCPKKPLVDVTSLEIRGGCSLFYSRKANRSLTLVEQEK